jgi:hypothetical protein
MGNWDNLNSGASVHRTTISLSLLPDKDQTINIFLHHTEDREGQERRDCKAKGSLEIKSS